VRHAVCGVLTAVVPRNRSALCRPAAAVPRGSRRQPIRADVAVADTRRGRPPRRHESDRSNPATGLV